MIAPHDPEAPASEPSPATSPPWSEASVQDVTTFDIDSQLPTDALADWHSLSDHFQSEARKDGLSPEAARVLRMLGGLFSMMLHPEDAAAPFHPMLIWSDGGRSAILEDFRPVVEAVAALVRQSRHPAVVSRSADVCWMLQRRRHDMGRAALSAYLELLDGVSAGELRFEHETDQEGGRIGIGILRRCVTIARSRSFGDQAPDLTPLSARIEAMRRRALAAGQADRHLALARLQFDFGLHDPAALAADIEMSVAELNPAEHGHLTIDALKVAASAYYRAKDEPRAHEVQRRISDIYVAMAEANKHSAMMASGFLADAISALAGIRDARDARRALRHRLVDVQAGIVDEMGSFSHPMDLEDLQAEVARQVEGRSFYDLLFFFAAMARSPDPIEVREEARRSVEKYPLSSLFAASYHDREGKVRHSVEGGDFGSVSDELSLQPQIAQQESVRRTIDVGALDVARRYLCQNFYIAPDVLLPVLSRSPFVPEGQERTFAVGLTSFLRGDAISAIYILAPLVEAGIRACLKARGYEVTTFDDVKQTQEDKTLSALYRDQRKDIEEVFGAPLAFDIEQVFLAPTGPTFRHGVAHGLLHDGDAFSADAFYACWLVLHICLLPLYPYRTELGLPSV